MEIVLGVVVISNEYRGWYLRWLGDLGAIKAAGDFQADFIRPWRILLVAGVQSAFEHHAVAAQRTRFDAIRKKQIGIGHHVSDVVWADTESERVVAGGC